MVRLKAGGVTLGEYIFVFQFHMVRLKARGRFRCPGRAQFQFHMVRLKAPVVIGFIC